MLLVEEVVKAMNLEVIAGSNGLNRIVDEEMICRPGMEFGGYFDFYESKRIILVGTKEASFLKKLDESTATNRVEYLFEQDPPAFLFSKNVEIPDLFIKLSNKYNIPLLKSKLRTTAVSSKLYSYLQEILAPRKSVHGVLVDIDGLGTLIIGKSGIGKSETALDLMNRGHQLVSDDRVEVFEKEVGVIIGSAPKTQVGFMEIRGIGIVNYIQMFGIQSFREDDQIELVVELEAWDEKKQYDRLGTETLYHRFFDTDIVKVQIPVLPGRNVALLVESAVANLKLKKIGYNGAEEFINKINRLAKGEKE